MQLCHVIQNVPDGYVLYVALFIFHSAFHFSLFPIATAKHLAPDSFQTFHIFSLCYDLIGIVSEAKENAITLVAEIVGQASGCDEKKSNSFYKLAKSRSMNQSQFWIVNWFGIFIGYRSYGDNKKWPQLSWTCRSLQYNEVARGTFYFFFFQKRMLCR